MDIFSCTKSDSGRKTDFPFAHLRGVEEIQDKAGKPAGALLHIDGLGPVQVNESAASISEGWEAWNPAPKAAPAPDGAGGAGSPDTDAGAPDGPAAKPKKKGGFLGIGG